MILACLSSKSDDDFVVHECQRSVKSCSRHPCKLLHLDVGVDAETIALGVLLEVLIREHASDHVYVATVGLSRGSS